MRLNEIMQSILVFGLLVFLPPMALAGTPGQDPAVALIRKDLARGLIPTKEQLKPGAKWKCLGLRAQKDDFFQGYFVISFSLFNGLIQPILWEDDGESKRPDYDQQFGAFAFNSKGLVGPFRPYGINSEIYMVKTGLMRLMPNGDIVIEFSIKSEQVKNCRNCSDYTTSAIYDNNSLAMGYAVCPRDQILPITLDAALN